MLMKNHEIIILILLAQKEKKGINVQTLRMCLDGGKMGEERKWEERKWRGKKMGEKMLSLIMLGWMRENRKEGKWVGEVGHDY